MGTHIILIGFMGAGKTTVGKVLAQKKHCLLFDTDQLIEAEAGMSVSRIFEVHGEEEFRRLETEAIRSLMNRPEDWVLSAGGGMPLKEENRVLLRQAGCVVYLKIQPETVLKRLKGDTTRPLLSGGNVKEKVETLLSYRGPVYENAAHITVEADEKTPGELGDLLAGICF